MKRKISIFGSGNMGSVLAAKFSLKANVCLCLGSQSMNCAYNKKIKVFTDNGSYEGNIDKITTNFEEAILYGEILVITYPAFMFKDIARKMIPLLKSGQKLLFIPGSGGAELFFKDAIEKGCSISGLQRVHCVARIIEKGVSVSEKGCKKELFLATIPNSMNDFMANLLNYLFDVPIIKLACYLNNTLINSNQILHTSRLYTIFKDYHKRVNSYSTLPLFYEEWDDESSINLIRLDKELFMIIKKFNLLGLNINSIIPILPYYESFDAKSLTKKIKSIKSLQGLETPHLICGDMKLIPDTESRYFISDFDFGLDILLQIGEFLNLDLPHMKKISNWYHSVISKNSEILKLDCFAGDVNSLLDYYTK